MHNHSPPTSSSSSGSSPGSGWSALPPIPAYNPYTSAFFAAHGATSLPARRDTGLEMLMRAGQPSIQCLKQPCLPKTRKDIIMALYGWAHDSNRRIACLCGPMGVGKSAVLCSVEELLFQDGMLAGCFDFQRDQRRNESVMCALAHQLARNIPSLRPIISRAVRTNPSIIEESMATQLQKLILEPCRKAAITSPLVVVLDGLDECDDSFLRVVLSLFEGAVHADQSPLRVLLASRISLDIFQSDSVTSFTLARSFDDVRTYLKSECNKIRHGASPWLAHGALDIAVRISCGCFLTARTLMRFLGDPAFCPMQRIAQLSCLAATPPQAFPHNPLDSMFFMILSSADPSYGFQMKLFLRVLTTPQFAGLSIAHMEQIIGQLQLGELRTKILPHLRALFARIPDLDAAGRLEVFHRSFIDFVLDPTRSGDFCVAGSIFDVAIAGCVLKALGYDHEEPRVNLQGHVAWAHVDAMVDFVTSVEIDLTVNDEILPFLQRVNPDYFFQSLTKFDETGVHMIRWLKNTNGTPPDLIALWEDYEYMARLHQAVSDFDLDDFDAQDGCEAGLTPDEVRLLHQPNLQRFIRTSVTLPALTPLTHFRLLLGGSYEDVRSVMCEVLRPCCARDLRPLERLWAAHARMKPAPGLRVATTTEAACGWGDVLRHLACNSIHVMQSVYCARLPQEYMGFWLEWGTFVRGVPTGGETCERVLEMLSVFEPSAADWEWGIAVEHEVHNVIKWLETVPAAPKHEVQRWKDYLPRGTVHERDDAYEARWEGTQW
ncbi:AAA-16 domain-containing protein [Mycena chlorophos]|uniref:AAA-16 domain-containing protein n=1 Tax=Mycena chlorophos TaxID=658473 RepID=A0A8H6TMB0_MYCCL|nr:AAA-16 domain-containing protein [Mycena chlorophos]